MNSLSELDDAISGLEMISQSRDTYDSDEEEEMNKKLSSRDRQKSLPDLAFNLPMPSTLPPSRNLPPMQNLPPPPPPLTSVPKKISRSLSTSNLNDSLPEPIYKPPTSTTQSYVPLSAQSSFEQLGASTGGTNASLYDTQFTMRPNKPNELPPQTPMGNSKPYQLSTNPDPSPIASNIPVIKKLVEVSTVDNSISKKIDYTDDMLGMVCKQKK